MYPPRHGSSRCCAPTQRRAFYFSPSSSSSSSKRSENKNEIKGKVGKVVGEKKKERKRSEKKEKRREENDTRWRWLGRESGPKAHGTRRRLRSMTNQWHGHQRASNRDSLPPTRNVPRPKSRPIIIIIITTIIMEKKGEWNKKKFVCVCGGCWGGRCCCCRWFIGEFESFLRPKRDRRYCFLVMASESGKAVRSIVP